MPNVRGKGDLGKRDLGRKGGKTHSFFSQSSSNLQSKQTVGSKGGSHPFKMISQANDKNKGGLQDHTSCKQAFRSWDISLIKPQEGYSVDIKSLSPSSHSTDLLLRARATG